MKKIDLGQTMQILANVGVVAGIVFLGVELRQNNELIAANSLQAANVARQAMASEMIAWQNQIAANETTARIYREGLADFNGLADTEKTQFDALMRSLLVIVTTETGIASALFQIKLPPIEEQAFGALMMRHLDQPGFQQWWQTADRRGFGPSTVPLVEELDRIRKRNSSDN